MTVLFRTSLIKSIMAISLLVMASQSAIAARTKSSPYQEQHYFGLIYGEADGGVELGSSTAVGFILSARNNKAALEYVRIQANDGVASDGDTWESTTQGIYYAIQGQGQSYMKLKIGRITQELSRNNSGTLEVTDEYYNSWGIGYGYKITADTQIEIEFTQMADFSLTSLTFLF